MTVKLNPGNIWSGSKTLAFLTNPTELAFRKGNVEMHYPISHYGVAYRDAEAAYQNLSIGLKANTDKLMDIMVKVLKAKLMIYPEIIDIIETSGGEEWLAKCSHIVFGKSKRWEGKGKDSGFIRCLIQAYEETKNDY